MAASIKNRKLTPQRHRRPVYSCLLAVPNYATTISAGETDGRWRRLSLPVKYPRLVDGRINLRKDGVRDDNIPVPGLPLAG
ncbi:TPA: hypothetical protein ACPYU1_004053 [Raoultella planticola]